MEIVKKRIIAFIVDYVIIILYALVLSGISMLVFLFSGTEPAISDPVVGQLIGFFTLTLPVFLYFYLFERGSGSATIGKRKMGLVVKNYQSKYSNPVFIRTALKLIPWEIAHTGVHWVFYFSQQAKNTPLWVLIILIVPQLIVIAYIISIFVSKGRRSIYDAVAGTNIEKI